MKDENGFGVVIGVSSFIQGFKVDLKIDEHMDVVSCGSTYTFKFTSGIICSIIDFPSFSSVSGGAKDLDGIDILM